MPCFTKKELILSLFFPVIMLLWGAFDFVLGIPWGRDLAEINFLNFLLPLVGLVRLLAGGVLPIVLTLRLKIRTDGFFFDASYCNCRGIFSQQTYRRICFPRTNDYFVFLAAFNRKCRRRASSDIAVQEAGQHHQERAGGYRALRPVRMVGGLLFHDVCIVL